MTYIPTYLYIKQHAITGLKYFGKTINDPLKYKGSGLYWKQHIKKHGKEHVITIWFKLFKTQAELIEYAKNFSTQHNIVESNDWANLIPENGINGGHVKNNHFKIYNKLPIEQRLKWYVNNSKSHKGIRTVHKPVMIDNKKFDAMRDAANFYKVTEQTIYNWIAKGKAIKL